MTKSLVASNNLPRKMTLSSHLLGPGEDKCSTKTLVKEFQIIKRTLIRKSSKRMKLSGSKDKLKSSYLVIICRVL
jgi:hypothetical protein